MNQGSPVTARALAASALVAGFLLLAIVVAVSLGGGSGGPNGPLPARQAAQKQAGGGDTSARFYVIKTGDTLSSIAHRTGVPVVRIQKLNPGVDPQILIAGEKLKLR
ncbi:MAG TPA: LysM domain-containing protein [Solirubrobacterales bacterium]|nr:LysM domain-containing protein [Solirubrobacterales bacterium]